MFPAPASARATAPGRVVATGHGFGGRKRTCPTSHAVGAASPWSASPASVGRAGGSSRRRSLGEPGEGATALFDPADHAAVATEQRWRIQVMCGKCWVPRDLDLRRAPKPRRYWSDDLETIFARVSFQCRCGSLATAIRVTRATRDASETLLLMSVGKDSYGQS